MSSKFDGITEVGIGLMGFGAVEIGAAVPRPRPSETLGKCGKVKTEQLLFGGSVQVTIYLECQT